MPTDVPTPGAMRACVVDGCTRELYARGLCAMHYRRRARTGSLELADRPTLADRFWANVADVPTDLGLCWEWTGRRHVHRGGSEDYGVMGVWDADRGMSITRMAHTVAWKVQMHRWPGEGCEIHHVCRNTLCVRAEHLLELPRDEHAWVHENWAPTELIDDYPQIHQQEDR